MFQIKKHDLQGLLWNTRLHIPSRDSPREKFISQPKVKSNVLPYLRVGNIRIIRKVYTKVHPFEMAEEDWWGEEGDILGRCIVI